VTEKQRERNKWVRIFHSAPGATRQLVCFAHAGGSASFFHPLSAALSPDTEVVVVQYPGREHRLFEEPVRTMDALADAVHEAVRPVLAERPVFFGHSMGAVVAFEVARRLERADGPRPERLVASACPAPSRPPGTAVRLLDDDGLLAAITALGGTDQGLGEHEELTRLILPAVRADFHLIENYRADTGAVVRCPVSVFLPDRDRKVTPETAAAWGEHTTVGADVEGFEGGHFYLTDRPDEFVGRLRRTLGTTAQAGRSEG
jgi:pyochelin biosynthetic protein PchC